jgi:hypothetical protein
MRVDVGLSMIWVLLALSASSFPAGFKIADLGLRVLDGQGAEHDAVSILDNSPYATVLLFALPSSPRNQHGSAV